MTEAERITRDLDGQWRDGAGIALCPAHEDRSPSLSIGIGANGKTLLHCFAGCAFRDIRAALVDLEISVGGFEPIGAMAAAARSAAALDRERRRSDLAERIWREARPIRGTLAERYLRDRGITCGLPPTLRYHPRCYHSADLSLPALVARLETPRGFAIHRTYLETEKSLGKTRVRKAKVTPAKKMPGPTRGGAVCLGSGDLIAVAEGIETALSLSSGLLGDPARLLSALSASGMAGLELPGVPGRLVIAGDGDAAGRRAAETLARRARSLGWAVRQMPAPEGADWNDVLRGAA